MKLKISLLFIIIFTSSFLILAKSQPVKIGVIGLTHSHVHWIFGSEINGDSKK